MLVPKKESNLTWYSVAADLTLKWKRMKNSRIDARFITLRIQHHLIFTALLFTIEISENGLSGSIFLHMEGSALSMWCMVHNK